MDSARLTYLFYRYVNQSCTEAEKQEFLTLVSHPEYEAQVKDLMKGLWSDLDGEKLSQVHSDRILSEIFSNAEPAGNLNASFSWTKLAAVVMMFIFFSSAIYFEWYSRVLRPNAQLPVAKSHQHQIIKLPDGSVVILNDGSTLEYPPSFDGEDSRAVVLRGEAYFDVRHGDKPFIVHTDNLRTTVLGTAFNIRAYPNDKNITVTVTRGKVKVSDDKELFGIITPDQQITFDKSYEKARQQQVDSRATVAWADKDIFFDDITLTEVAKQLEQRFQVQITFSNEKLKECRFTATFVKGETLDQILTVISEFNGSRFARQPDGSILMEGSGC